MIKYILLGLLLITNVHATDWDKEIKCLADNIYFEARNESFRGQLAVALVTGNRVKSMNYPNTICDVVWEYKQFSWTIDGKSDTPRNDKAYARSELIAILYITNVVVDEPILDYTEGATHYHTTAIDPYWSSSLMKLATIDNHIFYKSKK